MPLEVLLFHAEFTQISDLWDHFLGLMVEGQQGQFWSAHSAGHMAVLCRPQGLIVEADERGVVDNPLADDLTCGDTIHRFAFNPPLTAEEETRAVAFLNSAIGKPYNFVLIGEDIALAIVKYLTWIVSNPILKFISGLVPVDVLAGRAFICYQIPAGIINAIGRPTMGPVDPVTFGPLDVWGWQKNGLLTYEGTLTGDPDASGRGGPE